MDSSPPADQLPDATPPSDVSPPQATPQPAPDQTSPPSDYLHPQDTPQGDPVVAVDAAVAAVDQATGSTVGQDVVNGIGQFFTGLTNVIRGTAPLFGPGGPFTPGGAFGPGGRFGPSCFQTLPNGAVLDTCRGHVVPASAPFNLCATLGIGCESGGEGGGGGGDGGGEALPLNQRWWFWPVVIVGGVVITAKLVKKL